MSGLVRVIENSFNQLDMEETLPMITAQKTGEEEQCSYSSCSTTNVQNLSCNKTKSQGVAVADNRQVYAQEGNHHNLWAKAREKLPTIHLQNLESQSKEQNLGSSVEDLMTIKLKDCMYAILVYVGIGIVAYSFVFERWCIIDSLYFTVVTFTTVGYGDLLPTTEVTKLFTSLYSLVGVSILGVALGVIGSKVMEYKMRMASKADQVLEDTFMSLLNNSSADSRREILEQKEEEDTHHSCDMTSTDDNNTNVLLVLLKTYAPVFVVLLMGSFIIAWAEGWGWMTAIYYCTLTAVTVGYGDNVPSTELMRLFAVLYIPILVGVMSHFLGSVASLIMDIQRKALMQHMQSRSLLLEDLLDMDTDGDGVVTEAEFIVFMLTKMQKVDKNILDELRQHFRRFDMDNNGSIEKSDLYAVFLKTLKRPKKMLELSQYKASLLQLSDKGLSDNRHQIHLFDRVRSSVLKSVSTLTGWNKKNVR